MGRIKRGETRERQRPISWDKNDIISSQMNQNKKEVLPT